MILPAVWLAAAGTAQTIAGLGRGELVTYYLVSMTLSQFITCHLMWDMAEDIREGFINSLLMRPMSHFTMNLARNFAWRLAKLLLFIPVATLVFSFYLSATPGKPLHITGLAVFSVMMGQFLSFVAAYCVSSVAFWTTEFYSALRAYYLPESFLSGRLVPLTALPFWAQAPAHWLHFRYTNAFPVEMIMGKLSPNQVWEGIAIQAGWTAIFLVAGPIIFRHGLRRYTGVGM